MTKAIENHIQERVDKLDHYDTGAVDIRVSLEHDNAKSPEKQFACSMRLAVRGPDLFAEDCENDLYTAIDLVTKKLEQQIRKRHSKFKTRNHSKAGLGEMDHQEV